MNLINMYNLLFCKATLAIKITVKIVPLFSKHSVKKKKKLKLKMSFESLKNYLIKVKKKCIMIE